MGKRVSPESQVYQVGQVMATILQHLNSRNHRLLQLSHKCLDPNPKRRLSIEEIYRTCKQEIEKSMEASKNEILGQAIEKGKCLLAQKRLCQMENQVCWKDFSKPPKQ